MSIRTTARSSSNRYSASARASSVLPTPVGPRNRNDPIGWSGSCRPARERRIAFGDRAHRLVLPDDAPVQLLLEVDELLHLALHQPRDGDPRPGADDLGDVLLGDLLVQHLPVALELLERRVVPLELPLELDERAEPQLRRTLEVALALGAVERGAGLLDRLLAVADRLDQLLLVLPVRDHPRRPLPQVGEVALELVEALPRGRVGLLLQGGALDLELADSPLDLVDLDGHRVDLDPQPAPGLVDQVDRLVRQEPAGHVAVREDGGGDERRVLDPDAVVDLVPLLQAAQDGDRVLDAGLGDEHRLEPTLERRVLLDVLPVLVERRRADRAELASGQHRLQQVPRVHRALGRTGAHDRVQLIDERDDLAVAVGDLLEHRLEALLELAAVLRPGEHRAEVERHDGLALQALGDVAVDHALRQPFDDRGLADPGLADQDRVVLRAAAEHLDRAADLLVAADHRVELALPRHVGEVAPVLLERAERVLGVLARDAAPAADLGERRERCVPRDAGLAAGAGPRRRRARRASRATGARWTRTRRSAARPRWRRQRACARSAARTARRSGCPRTPSAGARAPGRRDHAAAPVSRPGDAAAGTRRPRGRRAGRRARARS